MEENKLKEFWDEVHTDIEISRVDIKEVIHKKHCNVISRMLRRQKTLIVLFAIFLIVSIAASVWDMTIIGPEVPFYYFYFFLLSDTINYLYGRQTYVQ